MAAKTYKIQTWVRYVSEESGPTRQYLQHQQDGSWWGWEAYEDGGESDHVELPRPVLIPLGYTREET